MAANDEFPRGWRRSTVQTTTACSLTLPGVPGISHVLDAFSFKLISGGTATFSEILLNSSGGTFTNYVLGDVVVTVTTDNLDSDSDLGLALQAASGEDITVSASVGAANSGLLRIKGYDV